MTLVIIVVGYFSLLKRKWPEEEFLGQDIQNLEKYLEDKDNSLSPGTWRIESFERLTEIKIQDNQVLYYFYKNDDTSWEFPWNTYGLYIVVENEKIILIQKFEETDGL